VFEKRVLRKIFGITTRDEVTEGYNEELQDRVTRYL
jgi:hypothetical protein